MTGKIDLILTCYDEESQLFQFLLAMTGKIDLILICYDEENELF